ncbi:MAG TPA: hypothetical protein PK616_02065 [Fibrobacteraceae bacterium]|nr:hypothetical protein [Fibrobacteraceae bacterium]
MKKNALFLILLLGLVQWTSAQSLVTEWKDLSKFSSTSLFSKLDSIGKNGNWMQYDSAGVLDAFMLKFEKKQLASWVLKEPSGSYLLAVLSKASKGERLSVYRFKEINTTPEALKVHSVLDPNRLFLDYKQTSETEFEHLDNPNLKVSVLSDRIRFTYKNEDPNTIFFPTDFKTQNEVEKRALVDQYLAFFEYEYSLMLRSFIQSTRGIFNWQPWHWYLKPWTRGLKISRHELEAILERGVAPSSFRLFYTKTKNGEIVQFSTNGNGYYLMEILLPR